MTKQLTDDIVQGMLSFLDNAQLKQLRDVVETTLSGYEITERKETNDSFDTNQNFAFFVSFSKTNRGLL